MICWKRKCRKSHNLTFMPSCMLLLLISSLTCRKKCFLTSNGNSATTEEYKNYTETFIQQSLWLHSNKIQQYAVRKSALKMFLIILSGDIELNPGPDICLNCAKIIRWNQRRITCHQCLLDYHLKCMTVTINKNPITRQGWTCPDCLHLELPLCA